MYVYNVCNGLRGPERWRTVDVYGTNGLLQHGAVINVVECGLVVDFFCPGRRSELVEFEKAFRCEGFFVKGRGKAITGTDNVEVLVQVSADQPWTWYPANFLDHHIPWAEFALVAVSAGGSVSKKIVSLRHIRVRSTEYELLNRRVGKRDFITGTYQLPDNVPQPLDPRTWRKWREALELNFLCKVCPVCFRQNELVYLQPGINSSIQSDYLAVVIESIVKKSNRTRELRTQPVSSVADPDDIRFERLYHHWEVMMVIFRQLTTYNRAYYRRVCSVWDALLQSDSTYKAVHVSLTDRSDFHAALCILNALNSQTEYVIIANAAYHTEMLEAYLLWIDAVLTVASDCKPCKIIFYECRWIFDDPADDTESLNHVVPRLNGTRPTVKKLMWVSCAYSCLLSPTSKRSKYATLPMATGSIRIPSPSLSENLYFLLEKDLPLPLPKLSKWVTDVADSGQETYIYDTDIQTILRDCLLSEKRNTLGDDC
ncbi:uncharacterized protein LOC129596437 [Paramacrobiotus metropolitanus]|uniref:uncharacterized protein LOC129596437 n=1 Tax=Paramacrobiotus metropolitanus TaxID=2943436 RepID=UPI002445B3D5|nr:uncharacterized protein LOC129596437 [Paramacrobiotus metropolitanus]